MLLTNNTDTRKFTCVKGLNIDKIRDAKPMFRTKAEDNGSVPVLCPWAHKGGVGKTTSSVALAEIFAYSILPYLGNGRKKVLLIDTDSQGQMSDRYLHMRSGFDDIEGHDTKEPPLNFYPQYLDEQGAPKGPVSQEEAEENVSSIADIFPSGNDPGQYPVPYRTANPWIDILPASGTQFSAADRTSDPEQRARYIDGVKRHLTSNKYVREVYAAIIFDTAPAAKLMTNVALSNSSHIYIPLIPEQKPIDGLENAFKKIARHAKERPVDCPLQLMCILPMRYQARKIHTDLMQGVMNHERWGKHVLTYDRIPNAPAQLRSEPLGFPNSIAFAEMDKGSIAPLLREKSPAYNDTVNTAKLFAKLLGLIF